MFEKTKARIEKLEETNETFRNVKAHVVKYQAVYAAVGGSVLTAVVVRSTMKPQVTTIVNEVKPVINNLPTFNNHNIGNVVNNGGYARKIIRCVETDEMWSSMKKAAEATGNHVTQMSKHCNGHLEDLQDLHYVIEGLAAG